ncbi:fluoride efflux transporter CrcB [Streptomyces europaeiscabiei]|uniref:Fluoride-specific ion channel FluC n=1 Tax=Streptomyces europaeiscabiei TaxID=146819 RepID=A0AAJ2PQN4_9ACTN|nr:fluoride efflux transporter CrcB [Streptomyces europaeiscabiei]MDX3131447.1 fluoride efflux transporter CrcB [Streptomyces europaeiscabiei]
MTVPHPDGTQALESPVAAPSRAAPWHDQAPVVAVVAVGGGIGAAARYGASLVWPAQPGGFPWSMFGVNVAGCFLIGLFMVVITDIWAAHRLVRPFFGTGVLGGFTSFSTYAVDIERLVDESHPRTALAYLAATLLAALTAVWLAATTARLLLAWRRR